MGNSASSSLKQTVDCPICDTLVKITITNDIKFKKIDTILIKNEFKEFDSF